MTFKEILSSLVHQEGYPCISVLARTHRTAPDNLSDAITLKNLLSEVEGRLALEFDKRTYQPLMDKLQAVVSSIDHNYNLDGMAIYVNAHTAQRVDLPFPIETRAIIDSSFAVRDIIRAANRSVRYYILNIARNAVHLYEGYRDTAVEVRNRDFPVTAHHGKGSAHTFDNRHEQQFFEWFNQLDKKMVATHHSEPLPIVLVGVHDHLAEFKKRSEHAHLYVAEVHGNHDHETAHELAQLAWEQVREILKARQDELVGEVEQAVGHQLSASGLESAWQAVREGRVGLLVVEEGYQVAALLDEETDDITRVEDPKAPGVMDDAVDELCRRTLLLGGEVSFVTPGLLEKHQHVAAVLRY